MVVTSKKQNYALFGSGAFGNSLRQWPTLGTLLDSGFSGLVTMRYNGRGGGGPCIYNLPLDRVARNQQSWLDEGFELERIYFNETAPTPKTLLQGELIRHETHGYALYYSTARLPMREALKVAPANHLGPAALCIAKAAMTPASAEDFSLLLDLYPDSAIEFSTFSVCLGTVPGRNTIIWEVRNY